MKPIVYISTLLLFITSCNFNSLKPKHKRLLNCKISFLVDLGDLKFQKLAEKARSQEIEIKYSNDTIYASYIAVLNECGKYEGNIEIVNDTIKLMHYSVSNEACTSLVIGKITFLIDNPDKRNKIILRNEN